MSSILAKWMTITIAIIVMTTPILLYMDSLHRSAVDTILLEASKKAAIEGMFTQEIIDKMVDDLVNNYNFHEPSINITATTNLTPRNQYIEASIEVPRGVILIIDMFNQGPESFSSEVRILSEYVDS